MCTACVKVAELVCNRACCRTSRTRLLSTRLRDQQIRRILDSYISLTHEAIWLMTDVTEASIGPRGRIVKSDSPTEARTERRHSRVQTHSPPRESCRHLQLKHLGPVSPERRQMPLKVPRGVEGPEQHGSQLPTLMPSVVYPSQIVAGLFTLRLRRNIRRR